MLSVVFWIVLGIFIGWNLPQPNWAKSVQEKIAGIWNGIRGNQK